MIVTADLECGDFAGVERGATKRRWRSTTSSQARENPPLLHQPAASTPNQGCQRIAGGKHRAATGTGPTKRQPTLKGLQTTPNTTSLPPSGIAFEEQVDGTIFPISPGRHDIPNWDSAPTGTESWGSLRFSPNRGGMM